MQKSFLSVKSLCLATLAGIGFASFLTAQPSLAQLGRVDGSPGYNPQDTTNPFSSNSGNFDPIDLVHRAQLGELNWNQQQKNEEFNSAVADYNRKRAAQQHTTNPSVNNTSRQGVFGLPIITSPSLISPAPITPAKN